MKASRHAWLAAALAVLAAGPAAAASNAPNKQDAVEQTIPPPIAQNPQFPPLHLSDDQRAKIRQALSGVNSEVEFQQKSTKPAQSFAPAVGAKIPKGLHPHALPTPLTQQVPALKRYTYLKFKQQVHQSDEPQHRRHVPGGERVAGVPRMLRGVSVPLVARSWLT